MSLDISNDGLEELTFINTKKWENNPNKIQPILIDAYEFKSMYKLGYIAFMYNNKTNKWNIKSFHLSDNRDISIEMALTRLSEIIEIFSFRFAETKMHSNSTISLKCRGVFTN